MSKCFCFLQNQIIKSSTLFELEIFYIKITSTRVTFDHEIVQRSSNLHKLILPKCMRIIFQINYEFRSMNTFLYQYNIYLTFVRATVYHNIYITTTKMPGDYHYLYTYYGVQMHNVVIFTFYRIQTHNLILSRQIFFLYKTCIT